MQAGARNEGTQVCHMCSKRVRGEAYKGIPKHSFIHSFGQNLGARTARPAVLLKNFTQSGRTKLQAGGRRQVAGAPPTSQQF